MEPNIQASPPTVNPPPEGYNTQPIPNFEQSNNNRRLKPFLPVIVLLLLMVIGVGVAAFTSNSSNAPDKSAQEVFDGFVQASMDVNSLEWDLNFETALVSFNSQLKADYTDPANVLFESTVSTTASFFVSADISQSYLDTGEKEFTRINQFDIPQLDDELSSELLLDTFSALKDQWIYVNDPELPDEIAQSLASIDGGFSDASGTVLGEFIFHDFSDQQESELLEFLSTNEVYSYTGDPASEIINNEQTYRYSLQINEQNLTGYNQKVAEILGIDDQIPEIPSNATYQLWLAVSDSLPRQVRISYSDQSFGTVDSQLTYSNFNKTFEFDAPKDVLSSDQVIKIFDDITQSANNDDSIQLGSSGNTSQQLSNDSERRFDVNAIHAQLEAFFAKEGFYPSATNLSDGEWITTNLPGLDIESLIDPSGDGYAYEVSPAGCDNVTTNCVSYGIYADLEDDGRGANDEDGDVDDYAKLSLN